MVREIPRGNEALERQKASVLWFLTMSCFRPMGSFLREPSRTGMQSFFLDDRNSLGPLLTCVRHATEWCKEGQLASFSKSLFLIALDTLCEILVATHEYLKCIDPSTLSIILDSAEEVGRGLKIPAATLAHNDMLIGLFNVLGAGMSNASLVGDPSSALHVSALFGACMFIDGLLIRCVQGYRYTVEHPQSSAHDITVDSDFANMLKFADEKVVQVFFKTFFTSLAKTKLLEQVDIIRAEKSIIVLTALRLAIALGDMVVLSCIAHLRMVIIKRTAVSQSQKLPSPSIVAPETMIQRCSAILDHVFSTDTPFSAFLKCAMWNRIITSTAISGSLRECAVVSCSSQASSGSPTAAQWNTSTSAMVRDANSIRDIVLSMLILYTPSLLETWISCAGALPVQEKLLLRNLKFPSFTEALLGAAEDILSSPQTSAVEKDMRSLRLLRAFSVAAKTVELAESCKLASVFVTKVSECLARVFHNLCTGDGELQKLLSVGQQQCEPPLSIPVLPAAATFEANPPASNTAYEDLHIAKDNSPTATSITLFNTVSWCVMCTEE